MSEKVPGMRYLAKADHLYSMSYASQKMGFYLGDFDPDHGVSGEAGIDDDRHIFICAGNRAGKGASLLIQNLIRWDADENGDGGGIFCIDPKGENAAITACRRGYIETAKEWGSSVRHCLERPVAILDPLGIVKGAAKAYRVNYNPFIDIDIDDDDGAAGEVETFCECVVMQEEGNGAHFTESASTILAGAIEYALNTYPREQVTWSFIRDLLFKGLRQKKPDKGDHPFAKKLYEVETPEGLSIMAGSIIDGAENRELGSIQTTLMRQMKWLNDRRMIDHLEGDGFSLKTAIRENWSVYVCIPPAMINRFRRWLRLMVGVALDAKTQSPFEHKGSQTLFILDEFAALGAFSQIETGASNLAGYGVKLVPVIQNIGQVQKTYKENWETFLGNAGAFIAWGLNDKASEDYVSQRVGLAMQPVRSFSQSENLSAREAQKDDVETQKAGSGSSESISLQALPIIWPNEVHEFGARETMRAFVVRASGKPCVVERINYFNSNLTGEGYYDDPNYIVAWEEKNG